MYDFLDICAGIGGFRLGMEQAGHKCVGFIERDKFAVKSYRAIHNTQGEFYHDDIFTVRAEELPIADAWCFGFPRQSFSINGLRRGFSDSNGTIIFKIFEMAQIRKPPYLFAENVRGLLSHDRGKTFAQILLWMDKLGYDTQWQVINSVHYVPQNRERVYIIGHLRTEPRPEIFPILQEYKENIGFTQTSTVPIERCDETLPNPNGKLGGIGNTENMRIRQLTPRECWLLQGFTDEQFEKAAAVNSDTQLYKQAGNSVSVPVIYDIARRLK
jgi:DNA (cytosine-5)-methyltransferase 1